MPFQKVETEKLPDIIARQVEGLILQGILRPGERLPAERELAGMLGVSRPSLRDALAAMQKAGLLETRASAGVFVTDVLGSAFSPALMRLIAANERAPFDFLEFRKDLEGLAAERAATKASDTDLALIDTTFQRMEMAHGSRSAEREAALHVAFHMAIVEASHNIIALHMMRSMYELLREAALIPHARVFQGHRIRDKMLAQHRAINRALQSRNGPRARNKVAEHLDFVAGILASHQRADADEQIARQRLCHMGI